MLKPVHELAALVRGGEISARRSWAPRSRGSRTSTTASTRSSRSTPSGALEAADAIQPGDERPFAGVPIAIKANVPVAGPVHELRLEVPRRPPARPQRLPGAPAARGRLRRRRHDEHAGVRDPADDRAAPHRRDPQPVEPRPHARRLLGRLGGRGRRRHAAGRARQRRRRLAPHPCRVLRARRPQAEPRARLARARPRRLVPRLRRRPHPHRRRDRAAARRARRLRGRRRDVGAAAGRAVRDRRCGATPAACASR